MAPNLSHIISVHTLEAPKEVRGGPALCAALPLPHPFHWHRQFVLLVERAWRRDCTTATSDMIVPRHFFFRSPSSINNHATGDPYSHVSSIQFSLLLAPPHIHISIYTSYLYLHDHHDSLSPLARRAALAVRISSASSGMDSGMSR